MSTKPQIFLSHASANAFEAELLQAALEMLLQDLGVSVWAYRRDQAGNQRNVGESLKDKVRESAALIILLSPETLSSGGTQWMELAYADAYEVPTFILLHRLTFESLLRQETGVPPLVLSSHCTLAIEWKKIGPQLNECCERHMSTDAQMTSEGIKS